MIERAGSRGGGGGWRARRSKRRAALTFFFSLTAQQQIEGEGEKGNLANKAKAVGAAQLRQ